MQRLICRDGKIIKTLRENAVVDIGAKHFAEVLLR